MRRPASDPGQAALWGSVDLLRRAWESAVGIAGSGGGELLRLYEAYKRILARLYGDASEEFFRDLFARHTAVQMLVLAGLSKALGLAGDPVDLCSGREIERRLGISLSLPHLNWWLSIHEEARGSWGLLRRAAEEVAAAASLVDWRSRGAGEVFRRFYEAIVDPGVRRRAGEYYTPAWIADAILGMFDLRDRVVVDPFSGPGVFLARAFHRKVEEGEDPGRAFSEIVGFDINPLAVAVARAELVLAYVLRTGEGPGEPPRVGVLDILEAWFGGASGDLREAWGGVPGIVVTNPPWVPVTRLRSSYSAGVRRHVASLVERLGVRMPGRVVGGCDTAVATLSKSLELAREGVGIVMSRDQAFNHRTPMRAGIVATYSILRNFDGDALLVDVDVDAFGHGVYPALVIARRPGRGERVLRILRAGGSCGDLRCDAVLDRHGRSYEEYVRPALDYFTQDLAAAAARLGVRRIVPMGLYIRGIFGGERRRGVERYAGLALEEHALSEEGLRLRLHGIRGILSASSDLVRSLGIQVYSVIYRGKIYPFRAGSLEAILSDRGPRSLREFLTRALEAGGEGLGPGDAAALLKLAEELVQPQRIETLKEGLHYTVYRGQRAFTAATAKPGRGSRIVVESHVAALECDTREKALYYAAALNYLAYKVAETGRSYARDQFARPALALAAAGLGWNNVDPRIRGKVAELAEALEEKVLWKGPPTQREALEQLYRGHEDFREVVELLDTAAGGRLARALNLVSLF